MSTLPRTRSLGRADGSLLSLKRERHRPSSLCEASYTKITPILGQDLRQEILRRTPSQANNLCTTVPTSLVNRNLGGRHAPTRSSLRHSRMVVARNGVGTLRWTKARRDMGRIGPLVATAQILVGLMALILAVWLLLWTPFLKFREIPHYSGIPVLSSGISAAIYLSCKLKNKKIICNVLKGIVVMLCCISILTCACVSVFSAFHLIQLAPMHCNQHHNIAIYPVHSSKEPATHPVPDTTLNDSERLQSPNYLKSSEKLREKEVEGSGSPFEDYELDDEFTSDVKGNDFTATFLEGVQPINNSHCVCEKKRSGWRIVYTYPHLNCGEVKNILPVLFVATCVVSTVGAILSGVILYIIWATRKGFYRKAKSSELRPFIFKSEFKNPHIGGQNGSVTNGNISFR